MRYRRKDSRDKEIERRGKEKRRKCIVHHGNVVALKIIVVKHKIHGQLESLEDREIILVLKRSVQFDQFVAIGLVK